MGLKDRAAADAAKSEKPRKSRSPTGERRGRKPLPEGERKKKRNIYLKDSQWQHLQSVARADGCRDVSDLIIRRSAGWGA